VVVGLGSVPDLLDDLEWVPDLLDDREWVPDLLDDREWRDLLTCLERSLAGR
jgi:hypothetical protein